VTFYQILGVSPNAQPDEIEQAFKRRVKLHHPDKGGQADRFIRVREAYETLSDPARRARYDATLPKAPPPPIYVPPLEPRQRPTYARRWLGVWEPTVMASLWLVMAIMLVVAALLQPPMALWFGICSGLSFAAAALQKRVR